jgi:hypothetical protein
LAYLNPSIADFKAYFVRDFPYGVDAQISILDADIGKAFGQVNFAINPGLFQGQAAYTIGYLYLAAYWLVVDIQMSSQGIAAQFTWPVTSKSVGSVSVGVSIPQRILDNPLFSMYSQNPYGAKYLQLLLPGLTGQIFIARGHTHA